MTDQFINPRWSIEVLNHISNFNRSLHVLLLQVEDNLPNESLEPYYRAVQDAYEAMKALQRRTEKFAELAKIGQVSR